MRRHVLAVISLGILTVVSATACGTSAGAGSVAASAPAAASTSSGPVPGATGTPGTVTSPATTSNASPATKNPASPATKSGTTTSADYFTYSNARFGFCVSVPVSLTANRPPDDGDGMSYSSKDNRVSLKVYGIDNGDNDTATSAAARFVAEQTANHDRVTLDSVSGDTYTVSGYDSTGTTIWYEHMIIESNVEYGIDWQYPAALASQINPEVTFTVHSYVPGPNRSM